MDKRWIAIGVGAGLLLGGMTALIPIGTEPVRPEFAEPITKTREPEESDLGRARRYREQALHDARVWTPHEPSVADLNSNPPDPTGLLSGDIVRCRFVLKEEEGTTPKFRCALEDGEVVKVKYGRSGEVPAELAGTRLLTALGFGADRMYLVPEVRCYSCPNFPFYAMRTLDRVGADDAFAKALPENRYAEFDWVVVERHLEGDEIAAGDVEGWTWFELGDRPDDAQRQAERDAFRLLAKFLAHWDNKGRNQRLICRNAKSSADACETPLAFIHDVGSTFGPKKVDLEAWSGVAVWADRAACRVSMRELPYEGGTFNDVQISEAGRRLLAQQLSKLTDTHIDALFRNARFEEFKRGDVRDWVQAFKAKVAQVTAGAPCPT